MSRAMHCAARADASAITLKKANNMERRKYLRSNSVVHVRIEAQGADCQGIARDISTRGIFVELAEGQLTTSDRNVRLHFEIDTGVQVLSRHISGKIVRNEGDGLAVRFAEHDVLGRAVVHELMYYMQLSQGELLPAGGCMHDSIIWADGHAA